MFGAKCAGAKIKNSKPKKIEIVAGPNGSGKTTFASVYLLGKQGRKVYLNPDKIAGGIAPLDMDKASFQAGRVLIGEIKAMVSKGESFAFESTLSGKTWLALLKTAVAHGYQVTIYFLYLDSVGRSVQRINKRVKLGGHSIPIDAIRRRHPRCFYNFWHLYRPLCSDWYVFENSSNRPKPIQNKMRYENLSETLRDHFQKTFLMGEIP